MIRVGLKIIPPGGCNPDFQKDLIHVAYHEAAHAVVCSVLGGRVKKVYIVVNESGMPRGETVADDFGNESDEALIAELAGPAMDQLRGECWGDSERERSDVNRILRGRFIAEGENEKAAQVHYEHLEKRAYSLCQESQYYSAMEALAKVLSAKRDLDERQIHDVIANMLRNQPSQQEGNSS